MTREKYDALVKEANELAAQFFSTSGFEAKPGFRFDLSDSTRAKAAWQQVKVAYEYLRQTDIDEYLTELREELRPTKYIYKTGPSGVEIDQCAAEKLQFLAAKGEKDLEFRYFDGRVEMTES